MKSIQLVLFLVCLISFQFQATAKASLAKEHYSHAKEALERMLSGKEQPSYEKAVFLIENAWWEGRIDPSSFARAIDFHVGNIKKLAASMEDATMLNPERDLLETKEQKIFKYRKALLNYAIYRYMTEDGIFLNEQMYHHKSYKYAFKDPMGTSDWTNTQITQLLNTKEGNCFALASLFRIFSERLESDAVLCTAPGHIYIRHADEKGTLFNVELSTRSFPGTGTIETVTHTPTEATNSGISLRELDLHQSIALGLVYLAKGYEFKTGIKDDDFLMSCAEAALRYDELNLNAMLLKAEVLEHRLLKKQRDLIDLQQEEEFVTYQDWMTHIFQLGYREMPYEMKNILIKGWTRDTVMQLAMQDHTPGRLNHATLKDTRYAGISWGLFDEEIKTKPLERYGNTVFDTRTKKIVAFLESDIYYNQYNFDPAVFAWNIDPLAHKFPYQSPYSAFGNNPIFYIDVAGAFQYPAKEAASYTKTYPMITLYLSKYVQNDIKKSPIVQRAVTKNTYGGYTRSELVGTVADWGNEKSPMITFEKGLTERTNGNALAETKNAMNIHIDADYALSIERRLGDVNGSPADKQAAMLEFYMTLLDETTHTGDLKDKFRSAPEVGTDATREIFRTKMVNIDGVMEAIEVPYGETSEIIQRTREEGQSEVLPTVPVRR